MRAESGTIPPRGEAAPFPTKAASPAMVHPNGAARARPSASATSTPTRPAAAKLFYTSKREDPPHLRDDPGLACLTSQLERIREQMRYLDYVKKSVARAEEESRRELAASLARSLVKSPPADVADSGKESLSTMRMDSSVASDLGQWVKHWDAEVGAEYFYNTVTGEASWLDPRYGTMSGLLVE